MRSRRHVVAPALSNTSAVGNTMTVDSEFSGLDGNAESGSTYSWKSQALMLVACAGSDEGYGLFHEDLGLR